jgi:hypothetical protein
MVTYKKLDSFFFFFFFFLVYFNIFMSRGYRNWVMYHCIILIYIYQLLPCLKLVIYFDLKLLFYQGISVQ